MEKAVRFDQKVSCSEIRSAIEQVSVMVKAIRPPDVNMVKVERDDHDHDQDDLDRDLNHCDRDLNHCDRDSDDDDRARFYNIPTKPFLSLCNLILQVLDRIGPTMAVLRQDVHQNIQRLEKLGESDPSVYSNLAEMLKREATQGIARQGHSSSKAFVWLTRSLDFTAALLQKLVKDPAKSMEQAVEEAYDVTLKPWHRWISSAAFRVAVKLVPDNETFIGLLMAKDDSYDSLKDDMQSFVVLIAPLLQDMHSLLRFYGLDRIKST